MFDTTAEFDRQVQVLLAHGYPALAGLSGEAFEKLVQPLREVAATSTGEREAPTAERAPFLLVVTRDLVPPEPKVALVNGFVDRNYKEGDLARFDPLPDLGVPQASVYLCTDVERGTEFLDVSPDDAMVTITARDRTPLTIDEGLAFLTLVPESLQKNKCYMLAGSRCGDRRVPALWISDKAPKLGWCWTGNRHTWLGIASCGGRATSS